MDLEQIEKDFIHLGFAIIAIPEIIQRLPILLNDFETLIHNSESGGLNGQIKIRKSDLVSMTGTGWSWGCDHIFIPQLRQQSLLDLASIGLIPTIIHRILGDRVRWTGGHGHWSPETYDYYLHWHRDTRPEFWDKGNNDPRCHVQVCVALTPESVIRIVPSSHVRDLESWEYRFLKEEKYGVHPDEVVINLPAGHVLFFNTYTLHRAYCSNSNIRRAIHFGFTRVNSLPEQGRVGKYFDWLASPEFMNTQSIFLRQCIQEQVMEQIHFKK